MQADDRVAFVEFVAEKSDELELVQGFLNPRRLALGLGDHIGFDAFFFRELGQDFEIFDIAGNLVERLDDILAGTQFGNGRLGSFLVVPEVWMRHGRCKLGNAFALRGNLKETP